MRRFRCSKCGSTFYAQDRRDTCQGCEEVPEEVTDEVTDDTPKEPSKKGRKGGKQKGSTE